jgi:hypothetical protein
MDSRGRYSQPLPGLWASLTQWIADAVHREGLDRGSEHFSCMPSELPRTLSTPYRALPDGPDVLRASVLHAQLLSPAIAPEAGVPQQHDASTSVMERPATPASLALSLCFSASSARSRKAIRSASALNTISSLLRTLACPIFQQRTWQDSFQQPDSYLQSRPGCSRGDRREMHNSVVHIRPVTSMSPMSLGGRSH